MKRTAGSLRAALASGLILLLVVFLSGCESGKDNGRSVTVGSKHFTEQEILGEIMSQLIENDTDIRVERSFNLGGTMVCFSALRNGDIDLYAEYTGTGLVSILGKKAMTDPEETYSTVKNIFREKFGLIWLPHFGFNNTYTLTMRKKQADSMNIRTISDLAPYKDRLQPGFDAEFLERSDGYRGLTEHYGFRFTKEPKQMDPGLMYKALAEGAVDVIDGFATDGRIPAYHLVALEDNENFFPPYYAAPLVRKESLEKYPGIKKALEKLEGMIDDAAMQKMNFEVDEHERSPAEVARDFLKSKGLLK